MGNNSVEQRSNNYFDKLAREELVERRVRVTGAVIIGLSAGFHAMIGNETVAVVLGILSGVNALKARQATWSKNRRL